MNLKIKTILTTLIAVCLCTFFGYQAGRTGAERKAAEAQAALYQLNRYSISGLSAEGTIYVIGHKSPDSDTVCTAIAWARLLNMLGYEAEPAITMPVNNETAYILKEAGVEAPEELPDAAGLSIFLVDHSEYTQAAEGMTDAHIVGILDHHGVGNVYTGHQIMYDARPIGATATIVWLNYMNYGLEIDKETAYLLLGAILSDTANLTVTSTTEADRAAVPALAEIAGVTDTEALYATLHAEALSYEGMTDEEILFGDYKEYETAGVKYGIGLVNALNEEIAAELAVRMKTALQEYADTRPADLMYASVGIRENGEKIDYIVPADEYSEQILKDAFPDYDEYNGTAYIFRTGLGRKTKFVPGLTDYLNAHPHE